MLEPFEMLDKLYNKKLSNIESSRYIPNRPPLYRLKPVDIDIIFDISKSQANVWKLTARSNMISSTRTNNFINKKERTASVTQKATTRIPFFTTKAMASSPVVVTTKKNAITNEELYWFIPTSTKRQNFVNTSKFNFKKAEISTTKRDYSQYDSYISSFNKTSQIVYQSRFVNIPPPMPFKFTIPTTTSFSTTRRSFLLISSACFLMLAAINYYYKNKSRTLCYA